MRASLRASVLSVWPTFWTTRVLIALVGVYSALKLDPRGGASGWRPVDIPFENPFDGWPLGGFLELILTPAARWDSAYYLTVAADGYVPAVHGPELGIDVLSRFAFFPLYPLLVKAGALFTGDPGAVLISALVISLGAFLVALVLLHKLVVLELGAPYAPATVLLLACFPAAFFFGTPYSESLFLALSVGAFYAARTERWWLAGALGALAALTRSAGVVLLLPLAVMYFTAHRRPRLDALALALVPLGLVAFCIHNHRATGDAFTWLNVQEVVWKRVGGWPFEAVWDGTSAAWDGVRQIVHGARDPHYLEVGPGDPYRVSATNLADFAFLVFGAVALVGCFRRLPLAYGLYVLASLALPLSSPSVTQPLQSLARFENVLFPLFMWLALVTVPRDWTPRVAVAFAIVLGVFTSQYSILLFVA